MALAQQALLRVARMEAGLLTCCLNETLDPYNGKPFTPMHKDLIGDIEVTRQQNRNYALADGFHRLVRHADSWKLFLRYQAQTERNYRRALEEFERLKALRHELPNEPAYDPQPEAKETTSAPSEPTRFPPESTPPVPPPGVPPLHTPPAGRLRPASGPGLRPAEPGVPS